MTWCSTSVANTLVPNTPAESVLAALQQRGETLGCAESVTGGLIAARLTDIPGSSAVFLGGVVSYATSVKRALLGVEVASVVAGDAAIEMAVGVRALLSCDWAISTTGVAGPERQEGMPVGTVYVAVAGPRGARFSALRLAGSRAEIRDQACDAALRELLRELG